MSITDILAALRSERDRLSAAIAALEALEPAQVAAPAPAKPKRTKKPHSLATPVLPVRSSVTLQCAHCPQTFESARARSIHVTKRHMGEQSLNRSSLGGL